MSFTGDSMNEQKEQRTAETVATSDPADLIIEVRELCARITELTQQASLHSDQCGMFEARIVELQEELRIVMIGRDSMATTISAYMEREERAYVEPLAALPFQDRVEPWLHECFGKEVANNKIERNHRFLEEALELVQACGCTREHALQIVEYVYGRPTGVIAQEVGGVMVTLAALCSAQMVLMDAAAESELKRVWTKIDVIREKQARKVKDSALPGSTAGETTEARNIADTGGGCSICKAFPAVNVEGTYWLCGPCVFERIPKQNIDDSVLCQRYADCFCTVNCIRTGKPLVKSTDKGAATPTEAKSKRDFDHSREDCPCLSCHAGRNQR